VNFKLEKLHELSGRKASVYTVRPEGQEETLFDRFVNENLDKYEEDVMCIFHQNWPPHFGAKWPKNECPSKSQKFLSPEPI